VRARPPPRASRCGTSGWQQGAGRAPRLAAGLARLIARLTGASLMAVDGKQQAKGWHRRHWWRLKNQQMKAKAAGPLAQRLWPFWVGTEEAPGARRRALARGTPAQALGG
jgi:hypothetical protein